MSDSIPTDRRPAAAPTAGRAKSDVLLWNAKPVVLLCAVALALTVGVIAFQMHERQGLFDLGIVTIFYRLFLFVDYPASLLVGLILLAALVPAVQRSGARVADLVGRHVAPVAACSVVVLAVGAVGVYRTQPLAMDEYTPYLQSQVFASGHLLGRYPPQLLDWLFFPGFQGSFVRVSTETGAFGSAYWPGFALLMTPFTAVGMAWLCNPVLGGLALVLIWRLTQSLTGSRLASGTAVLLMVASPAFLVNAISFYSMTAHMVCSAAFALLLIEPTPLRAAAAGLVGGLALTLHNPVPHMLFAAPWIVWLLLHRDRVRLVTALVAGYLPLVVVAGFGWHQLVSELAPADATSPASGAGPLTQAFAMLGGTLAMPNGALLTARLIGLMKLWIWATPALLLVAGLGFWAWRRDVRFQLLLYSAALTFVGYLFVPMDQGHGWGYRYFHSVWFVLPVFAASVLAAPDRTDGVSGDDTRQAVARYAQGAALGSMLILVPYFAWQVRTFIDAHLAQVPIAESGRPRVVIISPLMQYYAQDLGQNDPFLREPVIRMVSRGRRLDDAMMAREFPHLVILARSYKGTVWGYPDGAGSGQSASAGP